MLHFANYGTYNNINKKLLKHYFFTNSENKHMNIIKFRKTTKLPRAHFRSRTESSDYGFYIHNKPQIVNRNVPSNIFLMLAQGLKNEQDLITKGVVNMSDLDCPTGQDAMCDMRTERREQLSALMLSNEMLWNYEHKRKPVDNVPLAMFFVYRAITYILDKIYEDRPIARFYFLENVARIPYFAYVACLHFYETLGLWQIDEKLRKQHFEEEANETNHLLIMEALGGEALWIDRFFARHASMAYYIILLGFYFLSPQLAYKASELLERHAVDTYETFIKQNKTQLKLLVAPDIAKKIYKGKVNNLYDTFRMISYDEYSHANEMEELFDNVK